LGLWLLAIRGTNLTEMNDLGLVSVLSPWVWLAYLLLVASFCIELAQPRPSEKRLALSTVVLVFMLFGIATLLEDVARFGASWKHVGVIDLITRTGSVDPAIDAYNNWPGFFILGALFTRAAGLANAIPFLAWAPVAFNLLYLLPMRVLMRSLSPDRRLVWVGIWFFYLVNWVGQDYFAPQAFGYFLFLVILALLLTYFVQPGWPRLLDRLADRGLRLATWVRRRLEQFPQRAVPLPPLTRLALLLILAGAYLVVVASHQLTPFALLAGVTLLVIFNRLSLPSLPLIMALVVSLWLTYMAVTYLNGHLPGMLNFMGQLDQTVGTNLTSRLSGSPLHMVITRLRLVATLSLWGMAFLGGLRRLRHGRLDLNHALLALAPFPLIAMQSYGGELLLRIYLFAMPLMAAFAAAFFYPAGNRRPAWRTAALVGLVSAFWLALFLFIRFGNERMDYFTRQELAAVEFVYEQAEPGALLAAVGTNMPFRYQNYEEYKHVFLEKLVIQQDLEGVLGEIEGRGYEDNYVILTRSQQAFLEMFYNFPPETWEQLQGALLASGKYEIIYANPDARVYYYQR
jgi:hypothetical protein